MNKNPWLEQNEKWLEHSNQNTIEINLYREAKSLTDLQNLLNPTSKTSTRDIYDSLLSLTVNKEVDEQRSQILNYKADSTEG